MGYTSELRNNLKCLTAVGLGLGFGYMLNTYIAGIFGPQLISEFGWSKSQYALVGLVGIAALIGLPVAGRLSDTWGVKPVATIGVLLGPIIYLCISQLQGNFFLFLILSLLQALLVGTATTTAVYSRLIAENFDQARGSALAIAASVPALIGALLLPFLSWIIEHYDWRLAYQATAIIIALGGAAAIALIPRAPKNNSKEPGAPQEKKKVDYKSIIKNPAFRLLLAGMFFCNFTLTVQSTQLKLILMEQGMVSSSASWALSIYAIGVLLGRVFCGAALDRLPAHIVATIGLAAPGFGLLLIGFFPGNTELLYLGVLMLGLSMGAELDIAGYLVMRFFDLKVYSSAYSLIAIGTALSASLGSGILSAFLLVSDSFVPFLIATGIVTILGSSFFYRLKNVPTHNAIRHH